MTVYVDNALLRADVPNGIVVVRGVWSHLTATTKAELHQFAETLGLQRKWFQNKPNGWWHYDVTKSKRTEAINRYGAVPIPCSGEAFDPVWHLPGREGVICDPLPGTDFTPPEYGGWTPWHPTITDPCASGHPGDNHRDGEGRLRCNRCDRLLDLTPCGHAGHGATPRAYCDLAITADRAAVAETVPAPLAEHVQDSLFDLA